jgi:hypothetical protein
VDGAAGAIVGGASCDTGGHSFLLLVAQGWDARRLWLTILGKIILSRIGANQLITSKSPP